MLKLNAAADPSRRRCMAGALACAVAPGLAAAQADGLEPRDSGVADELRGLSLAGSSRWVSGAKGTVIADGKVVRPPGAEGLDFRGIHAFSARSAVAMSAGRGEASQLWRTDDAGKTWTRSAVNADPAGFWDAIAFATAERGYILGDPTGGRFTLLLTQDGGRTVFEPMSAPAGYLSSIAARDGVVIATGLAGTIVSRGGGPFGRVSESPFNTVRLRSGAEAELVGPKGAMARWRASRP